MDAVTASGHRLADPSAELATDEILATAALVSTDGRGITGDSGQLSGVRCGRPLVYPIPAAELIAPLRRRAESTGARYFGVIFAFDLDGPPPRHRYSSVKFDVVTDEPVSAVWLHSDGGALGLDYGAALLQPASAAAALALEAARERPAWLRRLAPRRGSPRAWVYGRQSAQFGWSFDDPHGKLAVPLHFGMHAVVEVPPELTRLNGALAVQVEFAGPRRGAARAERYHATLTDAVAFAIPLPAALAPMSGSGSARAVRLCMAADVAGYSRRPNHLTDQLQSQLVQVLAQARREAGLDESRVSLQPQGDGQFTVLPVGIDESVVIPRLVRGVVDGVRRTNLTAAPAARMRLRLALHRGLLKAGASGWVGAAAIAVHRIVNGPPVRAALRDHPQADVVWGVPDALYQDVIAHTTEPPWPDDFTPCTVHLPEKDFVEHCWYYVGTR